MPEPEGERIARLETLMNDVVIEMRRSRGRIHKLEGLAATVSSLQKGIAAESTRRQKRLERYLQVLTLFGIVAGIVEPILLTGGH